MDAKGSIEARLARLEALQAITELKARYAALADAKYTSAYQRVAKDEWQRLARLQAECFTEDAEWRGGATFGGTLKGRAALAEWFTRSPWRFAMHFYLAPELTLHEPQRAEGRWRLWQIGIPIDGAHPVLLAGVTHESYRCDSAGWRVAAMSFAEIHRMDLAAAPPELRCLLPRSAATPSHAPVDG